VALSPKTKGVLVIILFMAILLLPVCYALIRDLSARNEVKQEQPGTAPVNK
jgi:hypothetical protein